MEKKERTVTIKQKDYRRLKRHSALLMRFKKQIQEWREMTSSVGVEKEDK